MLTVLAGLLVTILATVLLPARWGHLRPLVSAVLGAAAALGVFKLIPTLWA